jgi:hypothetical protein
VSGTAHDSESTSASVPDLLGASTSALLGASTSALVSGFSVP